MKHACFIAAAVAVALLGFAAPANATHVSCGETITANTLLDSDVDCPAGTEAGVVIGASNITLNLGGFAIRAPAGSFAFAGIVENPGPVSGVQIRGGSGGGGTIEGFDNGVVLRASDSLVQGLTITAGLSGISLTGDRNSALLNVIEVAGGTGGAGIGFGGNNAYATRNTVRAANNGITTTGLNPRIVVNRIECGGYGIAIQEYAGSAFAVVARNSVTGCGWGIDATEPQPEGPGASVRRNLVTGNGYGMFVADPNAYVWCNTANDNTGRAGIEIAFGGATVKENTANNNAQFGIEAVAFTNDGGGNAATGNGITNCVNVPCGTTSTCTRSVGAG
jgi:hypothetical protein